MRSCRSGSGRHRSGCRPRSGRAGRGPACPRTGRRSPRTDRSRSTGSCSPSLRHARDTSRDSRCGASANGNRGDPVFRHALQRLLDRLTTSQGPGSRPPSQHRLPPRSETTIGSPSSCCRHRAPRDRGRRAQGHEWSGRAGRPPPRSRRPYLPCLDRDRRRETAPSRTRAARRLGRPASNDRSSSYLPVPWQQCIRCATKVRRGPAGSRWATWRRGLACPGASWATRRAALGLERERRVAVAPQRGKVPCCS